MKFLKKLFKDSPLSNQVGSTLTITIVVMAVLTFSVTSITKMTLNLSSATTVELNSVNVENYGQGVITQSINELVSYMNEGGSYTDFNNVKIPEIYTNYLVDVDDVTSQYPEFGDHNGSYTAVYRFAYDLNNGDSLVKYTYLSSVGTAFDTPNPISFSIGTDGDLILNGGYYEDINMYGRNVYISNASPWYDYSNEQLHYLTPSINSAFPTFSGSTPSRIYSGTSLTYCIEDCFNVTADGSSPYILNTLKYSNVVGGSLSDEGDIQNDNIISFLGSFDYEEYALDYVKNILPTNSRTIDTDFSIDELEFATVIRNNMGSITYKTNGKTPDTYPSTAYVEVSGDSNYNFSNSVTLGFGAVYDGNLEANKDLIVSDYENEGLIVLGNLTLNNTLSNKASKITGTIIVTGDLIVNGYSSNFQAATLIVFGQTIFQYDDGFGIQTQTSNKKLSIIGQDNIIFDNVWENYTTGTPSTVTMLAYSEESIYMDMVESKLKMQGALYAKALGTSDFPIFMKKDSSTGSQVNGILINSYRGFVSYINQGSTVVPSYSPSASDSSNRFWISSLPVNPTGNGNANGQSAMTTEFISIPEYDNVVIGGDYVPETSEWILE